MAAAVPAARFSALEAELAAKASRISELEARVSCLEAENARLRKALAEGEGAGRAAEGGDPVEKGLRGRKRGAVETIGGGVAGGDVIVLSDGEEGIAVDASKGGSREEGVVAVPTPRKRAARVVIGESEDEEDAQGVQGGNSGSSKGNASCDSNVRLEDDDVSTTARGKKRAAARVVTSDSEDEDLSQHRRGTAKDGYYDDQEDGVMVGRKRALCGVSDSENEDGNDGSHLFSSEHAPHVPVTQIESREDDGDDDDRTPICQVFKKMRKERVSDDGELDETKGCSTPTTRHSARLAKNQSKGGRAARRALNFVEPKEYEGSEDDMEEDDDMDDFINDDDSSESASDSAGESCAEQEVSGASAPNEESSPEPEDSDSEIDYADVIACIGRKRKTNDWEHEGQMLSAFDKYPELCLKAVCALYRKQTKDEQLEKATLFHNKQGFNQIDALRGSHIAEFLLDGDPNGPVKKTVAELKEYDRYALEFCHKVATRYSKQLFGIYQNKEDPYFLQ